MTRLNELLTQIEQGEHVVLTRDGSPVARSTACSTPTARHFGGLRLNLAQDFDGPLSEEELVAWE